MADNVVINANTPNQATMRASNNAGVFTPHSDAELWVANAAVTNSNAVPVLQVLSNGSVVVAGSNAFPVVENNSANIAALTSNVSVQVANTAALLVNVAIQVANVASLSNTVLRYSNGVNISNSAQLFAQRTDAANIPAANGVGTGTRGTIGSLFGTLETTGYQSISVQITNTGNGASNGSTISYLGSDDNTNWVAMAGSISGSGGSGGPTTNTTSNTVGIMTFGVKPRYFQANVSTYAGAANVAGTYVFRGAPHFSDSIFINNNTANAVNVFDSTQNTLTTNTNIQVANVSSQIQTVQALTIAVNTSVANVASQTSNVAAQVVLNSTQVSNVAAQISNNNLFYVGNAPAITQTLINSIAASADIIAAQSAKKITVYAMTLQGPATAGGVNIVTVQSNTTPTGNLSIYYVGNTGVPIVLPFNPVGWFKNVNVNESIRLNLSNANVVSGVVVWSAV